MSTNCAFAQIIPDGTLPNNSSVKLEGNNSIIEGGTQAGGNLFHSFREFSVPTNGAALFNNKVDIQNIISRVTGGSVSKIDGLIGTKGTANLFLINPNGIIFGQNAQLNVNGSFVASTANALQFGNIGFFSATAKNIPSPLLTINPSALLFNQINQNAAIQNNSVAFVGKDPTGFFDAFGLRVPDGKSLLLVGGNVSMDGGKLNAYGGRVELGGLAEPGTVLLGVNGDNLSLKFPENVGRTSVSLTNGSRILVTKAGGGNIAVNAKNLEILGGSILSGGIGQDLGTSETVAGDITLNATGSIKVAGIGSSVRNIVGLRSKGNAGNITIDSGSLSLQDGARLTAETRGRGNAGNVTVRALNAVSLANGDIDSTVSPGGVGKGGNIDILAATLSLKDGAQLQTFTRKAPDTHQLAGQGDAGNVNVNVTGAVDIGAGSGIRTLVETETVGNAGNITINSGSLSLQDGARLTAETRGRGNAGNVTVRALDAVSLANGDIDSTVSPGGVGKGGNIDILAATLSLKDGAQLATSTRKAFGTQPAGQGDAGNVNMKVTGIVDIGAGGGIRTLVEAETVGNAGNITIDSGSLSLQDGARLTAETRGRGNAGNVTVQALDAVSLANGNIDSTVSAGGVGKGGNIDINAATLSLKDGAQLATSTRDASDTQSDTQPAGQGDAGNVNVKVTGIVDIAGEKNDSASGIRTLVEAGTVGNAGNITIDSGSLSLQDGAQLTASTRGQGDAGNVNVNVTGIVDIAGEKNDFASGIRTLVEAGTGNGGNITIDSGSLSLRDGALLTASTRGQGDAGNVNVNVTGIVDIAGVKNNSASGIRTSVETETVGNGGNITIDSGSFSLSDGARLTASTRGQGDAGNVTVRALDAVSLANSNIDSTVSAGGIGKGGNIDINAATLSLKDGAQLQTFTRKASATAPAGQGDAGNVNVKVTGAVEIAGEKNGSASEIRSLVETGTEGNGGNITIDSGSFSLSDGARLTAETRGQANAGTIKVNAADFFTISSNNSDFNSGLFVNSQSTTGTSGDIIVTSPRVTLDNGGRLNAQSASGNGGNINLQTDLLLLRRGASISTSAGTAEAGGNGGNITINAPSGFIVAVPNENSDITADAFRGNGGRVDIQAFGIYGIQPRSNPTSLSDIRASSEFGVNGTVELNTPDVDPSSGLVNLPTIAADTEVAQTCEAGRSLAKSSFTITGRGGLPPNPGEALNTDAVQVDLVTLNPNGDRPNRSFVPSKITTPAPEPIIEATGLALNEKGEVVLTANLPTTTPHSPWLKPASCRAIHNS
ncbi:filamentous hemagglutinin N-terminal domain-containing protein [Nostoc sp. LPT]|uniref:two-partner secretion domain-containing protein n=1 Tax=Nostoc sp. LPT TaxID=2815387 RepID=UPI0025D8841B|nr:filamentous hemagglutinin N-terminal domain-containing protein [Nostoc sp. LPT]